MGKVGRPKGFKMSEESKRKTSESMKGKQNTKGKHGKQKEKKCD